MFERQTPEDMVNDYLIGKFEIEKLKNGFQAPVTEGECADRRDKAVPQEAADAL